MEPEQLKEMNNQLVRMMTQLEELRFKNKDTREFSEMKEITREYYTKLRRQLIVCVADELHAVLGSIERSNPDEWKLLHQTLRYPFYFPREEMDELIKNRIAHTIELKRRYEPQNITEETNATVDLPTTVREQENMLEPAKCAAPLNHIAHQAPILYNALKNNDSYTPQRALKAEPISPPMQPQNPYAEYASMQSTPTQFFIQPNVAVPSSTPLQMPKHHLPLLFKTEPRQSPPQLPEQPQQMQPIYGAYSPVAPASPISGRYMSVAVLEHPKEELKESSSPETASPHKINIRKSPNSHLIVPPFVTNYSIYTRKSKTPIQVLQQIVLPKSPTAEQIEISLNPYLSPQIECDIITDISSHSVNKSFGAEATMTDPEKKLTRRRKPGEKRLEKLRKFIPPVRVQQFIVANTYVEDGVEAVMLGLYGTAILKSSLYSINWTLTGPAITRKILIAIFDRKTLADNSLTGKPSPAFPGFKKPTKGSLSASVIEDIIFFLTNTFPITEKEVRSAVTTKCADENKMRRNRATKEIQQTDGIQQLSQMEVDEDIEERLGGEVL